MILSDSHRFIFIHVPKTAGRSIEHVLEPYHYLPSLKNRLKRRFGLFFPIAPAGPFYYHIKARQLRLEIGADKFDSYFKFAFVRNPFDWLVSLYFYTIQTPQHVSHRQFKKMKDFEECIEWMTTHGTFLQKDYICDENNQPLVDFIGRYENLQADLQIIEKKLNIPILVKHHFNPTQRQKDYKSYYTTAMKDKVYRAYKADIELFGYEF